MPKTYDDLKSSILKESRNIVMTEGIHQLSMRGVAAACSVAVGTLYNYYPTKESLVSELMYNYWVEFIESIQKTCHGSQDFYLKLRHIDQQLKAFTLQFHDTWIKMSNKRGHLSDKEYAQKNDIVFYLIDLIEKLIINERNLMGNVTDDGLSSKEVAAFIVQNFLSLGQFKLVTYDGLESIIKKIV